MSYPYHDNRDGEKDPVATYFHVSNWIEFGILGEHTITGDPYGSSVPVFAPCLRVTECCLLVEICG